jgi:hypothetical protein
MCVYVGTRPTSESLRICVVFLGCSNPMFRGVRRANARYPIRRAWRPLANARGDNPFCHSEARSAEESPCTVGGSEMFLPTDLVGYNDKAPVESIHSINS